MEPILIGIPQHLFKGACRWRKSLTGFQDLAGLTLQILKNLTNPVD